MPKHYTTHDTAKGAQVKNASLSGTSSGKRDERRDNETREAAKAAGVSDRTAQDFLTVKKAAEKPDATEETKAAADDMAAGSAKGGVKGGGTGSSALPADEAMERKTRARSWPKQRLRNRFRSLKGGVSLTFFRAKPLVSNKIHTPDTLLLFFLNHETLCHGTLTQQWKCL